MQRALMTAAFVGSLFGGYYFAGITEYEQMPSKSIAAYDYYAQPDDEVTFHGDVVFIWADGD